MLHLTEMADINPTKPSVHKLTGTSEFFLTNTGKMLKAGGNVGNPTTSQVTAAWEVLALSEPWLTSYLFRHVPLGLAFLLHYFVCTQEKVVLASLKLETELHLMQLNSNEELTFKESPIIATYRQCPLPPPDTHLPHGFKTDANHTCVQKSPFPMQ